MLSTVHTVPRSVNDFQQVTLDDGAGSGNRPQMVREASEISDPHPCTQTARSALYVEIRATCG